MNKKAKWIVGILVVLYLFNGFFTENMVVGTYVNRNYENDFALGVPHVADTLIIYTDNKFYSPYYGKGDYKLVYSLAGTRIQLNYRDEYGSDSFTTSIDRLMIVGNPKINLFKDLDQYYEKIE